MSASREKQNRQAAQAAAPKTAREAQQRREEKRSNLLYGLIAVVFLIILVVSAVWRSNIIPKMATAATIDGEKYSAAEVSYYYNNAYQSFVNQYSYFVSYLGLDTSAPLKDQLINETAAGMLGIELPAGDADAEPAEGEDAAAPAEGEDSAAPAEGEDAAAPAEGEDAAPAASTMTWQDYFIDQALNNMTVIQKALEKANEEGFTFPESVQVQRDANMDTLKAAAAASNVSVNQYLGGTFGAGMTEKVYSEQLLRTLQYSAYVDAYSDSLTYSDAELEAVYAEDPKSFDHVSYEYASFSGAVEETVDDEGNTVEPTEEETEAAMEAARSSADALLEDLRESGDLEALSSTHDASYAINEEATYYAGSPVSEWLYEDGRQDGDSEIVVDGTTVYVLLFHERFREEYNTIDVRHILVPLGAATLTEEDEGYAEEQEQLKADAKAKAEELLAQWQSGDATEESFAALAMAESTDGSRYDGGLYSEVYQGQMVAEFNDWCFDASRKPGDTGVVETQYGAHVMYFSGTNLPRWAAQAASQLRNEDYLAWETSLTEGASATRSDFGMRFIA